MRILVVGHGAREHALLWKLRQSHHRPELLAAPGNAGTADLAKNIPVSSYSAEHLLVLARAYSVDVTILGRDIPLVGRVMNHFRAEGRQVLGPTQLPTSIAASIIRRRNLIADAAIPTADFRLFTDYSDAAAYVQELEPPLIVRTDGPAPGHEPVARTRDEVLTALRSALEERDFAKSGSQVLIEKPLIGDRLTAVAAVNHMAISPIASVYAYLRLRDGDTGPLTPGMGAYSPVEYWDEEWEGRVRNTVILPLLRALTRASEPFAGVLQADLLFAGDTLYLLDFESGLGDLTATTILPRLETDLVELIESKLAGRFNPSTIQWSQTVCVTVVMTSGGYPERSVIGLPISGLGAVHGSIIFHGGTTLKNGQVLTSGGRVVYVVGQAANLSDARGALG